MGKAPEPPFIQAAQYSAGGNKPIYRIVMHATVSPTKKSGARDIANYFHNLSGTEASAHYVVDPGEVIQCVNDWDTAWHAPPNEHSIGVELCDPQKGRDKRWDDKKHQQMLDRAADLVKALCEAYDIPKEWLMPGDLKGGKHGITDHDNVSAAWGQTDHTDPGWSGERSDDFIARVKGADGQKLGNTKPSGGGGSSGGGKSKLKPKAPKKFPLKSGHYFGLISGPADSHGGYYGKEKPYILAIQRKLIKKGYVPGVSNPKSSWADGVFEQPTKDAVKRFQKAERPNGTTRWGEVWADDWATLMHGKKPGGGSGGAPKWPLKKGQYFGPISGPADSHGGYNKWEKKPIRRIQRALISQGYVPGVSDPKSSWADGVYEKPTVDAVKRFQKDQRPDGTTRWGEVWADDWATLLG